MFYLLNKSGAVVEVEKEELRDSLLKQGFTEATPRQIEEYEKVRNAQLRQMTTSHKPTDVYFCTVSAGGNGYGMSSQKIMQQLDEMDVSYSQAQKGQKIGFLYHQPYSLTLLDNPIKIIYTMFESDNIPGDWKPYLDAADLILVPSHFCMEIFAKAGYNARVVPLGFDDSVFTYVDRSMRINDSLANRPFTFLHYDAFNKRKGFQELFKAFVLEFGKDPNVQLYLKTSRKEAPLPIMPSQYPNIVVETGECSDTHLSLLCAMSDCFVFPSMGEGFGITPLEAMGTGLPVIVPNAHGISEYFNHAYMYEVKHHTGAPAVYSRHREQNTGSMIQCDVEDLRKQMRFVYEHQEEARSIGRMAATYARNFTYKKTAEALKEIFVEFLAKDVPPRPANNILTMEKV